jgi:hypothetical protein
MPSVPASFSKLHFENQIIPKIQGRANRNLLKSTYQLDGNEEQYQLVDDLDEDINQELEHQLIKAGLLEVESLEKVATTIRKILEKKRYLLLFAYNGTGKTRLSVEFKDVLTNGKKDTLYFNAFTEDLFSWDNDLENDENRKLKFNKKSKFFKGIEELDLDSKVGILVHRYADYNFIIDYDDWEVTFFRERDSNSDPIPIKVSRGEENIFIWCFFLAIAQLAMDKQEAYDWIKYIYIDDPISSLDENNAIAVAHHLATMFKKHHDDNDNSDIRAIVSSHHTLFFNVMCNEWNNAVKLYFSTNGDSYLLKELHGDTARIYHIAMLKELKEIVESNNVYTYHFNVLRSLMEKAAVFHGYSDFGHFIKFEEDDNEEHTKLKRILQIMNHSGYSMMEPREMGVENKKDFIKIFNDFIATYPFNITIFNEDNTEAPSA